MAKADAVATVLPDGCRDILVISKLGQPPIVRLTDWDMRPQTVAVAAGTKFLGYRLCPGSFVDPRDLANVEPGPSQVTELIESQISSGDETFALIEALSEAHATVRNVSRYAGVTVRTLQRRFRKLSLPPPEFWRLLGRARKAAMALTCNASLAEVAYAFGYSDQAHMTREFVRWFGSSPTRLRRDKVLLDGIVQPALGNWTGEQISIR